MEEISHEGIVAILVVSLEIARDHPRTMVTEGDGVSTLQWVRSHLTMGNLTMVRMLQVTQFLRSGLDPPN